MVVATNNMTIGSPNDPYNIGSDGLPSGILSSGIGTPQLGQTNYSSESIDDLINNIASPTGFGQIAGGLGNIFGGLMGAGQSVLNSPDALMGLAGGLLTKESYDRLSDIGSQAKQEAMGLAERGQRESEFRPFTVTTPTGAMFTSRMSGQPSMGQPMPQPFVTSDRLVSDIGQPSMMLPPNIDQLISQIDMQMPGQMPQPGQLSPTEAKGRLLDLLGSSPSSSQFAPPPGMSARPEMPMMQTADMAIFTDPITGREMSGSGTLEKYRRQLKDYYDATPGSQQYYEGMERQQQMERFPSLFGAPQPERLAQQQPTTGGLQVGMTLSPQEQALQQQLLGGAGGFFGQAAQPTMDREQAVFERIRAAQRPEEQRQRLALEERLAAQGRLGTSSAAYGGATPELMAQQTAIQESRNQAMLSAMQQAQAEQAQQAALGQTFLGSGYMPQQALLEAAMPGIMQQELAQQGQQFGTGLFAETGLSGIEAQLLQEQARANLLGGIGGNLISGIINQQRAATAAPSSSGGGSSLGGLFGGIVDGLGDVGSGIKNLLGIGG